MAQNVADFNQKVSKREQFFRTAENSPVTIHLNIQQNQRYIYASQFRQTAFMKRYKYNKVNIESRANQHHPYEILLQTQPIKSEVLERQAIGEVFNKIIPPSASMWVSNSKKMQKKWSSTDKRSLKLQQNNSKLMKRNPPFFIGMNNEIIPYDDKQYFHSMRNYLKNYKRKVEKQRKVRIQNTQKDLFKDKNSLNIIRLCPFSKQLMHKSHFKEPKSSFQQNKSQVETSQRPHIQSTPITNRFKLSSTSTTSRNQNKEKLQSRIFKSKTAKTYQCYNIFGKIKIHMSDEELQRLKNLYFRDFIWKIGFNRGFLYENSNENYRYYVGKGNNSRLIKKIMKNRSWWVEQNKQENAHFIWTQLKIYDIYKNQKSLKPSQIVPQVFTTVQKSHCDKVQMFIQDKNTYILNKSNYQRWKQYIRNKSYSQKNVHEDMRQRKCLSHLEYKLICDKITNHLQFSRVIGNKKALYKTMITYFNYRNKDQAGYLPMTFHITGGLEDQEYLRFLRQFYKRSKQGSNHWIVKPGQLSNRGRHIKYCGNLQQIKDQIKQKKVNNNGSYRTYIVQSYLQKPFLYQGRKFDIRHYLMISSTQGKIRGYFYQQGYVRTTSYIYSLQNYQPGVHLTNDAVQKYLPNYSKYQKANKLSYNQLNDYMLKINPNKGFYNTILPQIKSIGTDIMYAAFPFIDPDRKVNNFQIFGIDIMIDENYKCWLIQVNTNPCIEVNCKVLAAIIPNMLDNAFTICLDSIFTPPIGKLKSIPNNYVQHNKFQLVFDEQAEGAEMLMNYHDKNLQIGNFGDDDDEYESCNQEDYTD